MHWFIDPIKDHYADFNGRAGRQEFWMYILVYIGVYVAVSIVASIIHFQSLTILLSLGLFVPGIAIVTRRLHDIDKSGWWQLIGLIPLLGWIVIIIWLAQEGKEGDNQYGSNPKGSSASTPEVAPDIPVVENTEEVPVDSNQQGQ